MMTVGAGVEEGAGGALGVGIGVAEICGVLAGVGVGATTSVARRISSGVAE